MITDLRLWQLISPAFPVGAYAYSQGLESAVEMSKVMDTESAYQWIAGLLHYVQGQLDAPIFLRMYRAWDAGADDELDYWNGFLLASRESKELEAEDIQMARALLKIYQQLQEITGRDISLLLQQRQKTYLLVYALATSRWQIDDRKALQGYLWSWCENQVAAAIKLIPLGQTAGQQLLSRLMVDIEQVVLTASQLQDDEIGSSAQGLGILSAQHEQQYSRLFRS